jgi:hypothetical protein
MARVRLSVAAALLATAVTAACASEADGPDEAGPAPSNTEVVAPDEDTVVAALAESFAADGALTTEQAACVAAAVVDSIGLERLAEITSGSDDFVGATAEHQQEMTRAVLDATAACGIPLGALSGG